MTILRAGPATAIRSYAAAAYEDPRSVQIRQVRLEPVAEIAAGNGPVGLLSGRYRGVPVLLITGTPGRESL